MMLLRNIPVFSRPVFSRQTVLGLLMVALLVGSSGCKNGSAEEMEKLKAENASLKAELETLKSQAQSAQQPTAEGSTVPLSAKTFSDIETVPSKAFIHDLAKLGVFEQLGETFKPYEPITRGEFVTWLALSNNKIMPADKQLRIDGNTPPVFKDLKPDHPAFPYAQALANAGYSVGYQDGTFKADKPITREEMIAIKTGVDAGKPIEPDKGMFIAHSGYTDAKDVDERYMGYIAHQGEFRGPRGSVVQLAFGNIRMLKPKTPVLRHEAAGALWQFGGGLGGTALNATDILKSEGEGWKYGQPW